MDLLSEVHPFRIGPKKSLYIVNTYTVIYMYIYIHYSSRISAVVSLIFIQNIHLQYTETDSIPAQRSLPSQSYGLTAEQQGREEHESGVLRATNGEAVYMA